MVKINSLVFSEFRIISIVICLFAIYPAFSQNSDKFDFTVTVNSDQYFGFYPYLSGIYSISETTAFTFYGILWSAGTGRDWGNWTEFGVGLDISVADGILINPSIGLVNGSLLSSSGTGPAVFGEGIAPTIVAGLNKKKVEGEFYMGYYTPIRDEAPVGGSTSAYLHYWANFGVKTSDFFSFGIHYEQLDKSAGFNVDQSETLYQWLGPYVQFSDPKDRALLRFAGGGDLVEGNDSFFKLTTGFNF